MQVLFLVALHLPELLKDTVSPPAPAGRYAVTRAIADEAVAAQGDLKEACRVALRAALER